MLQERNRVKTVQGVGNLTLTAQANESFRIKGVHVFNPVSSYATLTIERHLAAFIRVGGNLGNHAAFPNTDKAHSSLYNYLINEGIFKPLPVPSGMTVTLEGVAQAGSVQTIIYDVFDAGDVSSDEPNGPNAIEYYYLNYGQHNAALADGENLIDTQITSRRFPSFPFSGVVPAKYLIEILGIAASDYATTSGGAANKHATTFLKFNADMETLFDDDLQGLPLIGVVPAGDSSVCGTGQSIIGNLSDTDERLPLLFEKPLVYEAGQSLDVILDTVVSLGVANLAAADTEICLITKARRM